MDAQMKTGDFVYFTDGHGVIRKGNLLEKVQVLGEIPVDEAGFQGRYKKVDKWEWEILTTDKKRFCIEEKDISIEPIRN